MISDNANNLIKMLHHYNNIIKMLRKSSNTGRPDRDSLLEWYEANVAEIKLKLLLLGVAHE